MKGANVQGWEISTRKPIRLRTLNRHERKRLSVTHQGRLCARPAVSRNAIPHNGRLTRTSPSSSRKAVWPARAARLPDIGALQPGEQMPAPAVRSHAGQVPGHIPNTSGNNWTHPPRSCYFYCMISPIRGNRTDMGVQVPLGHINSPYPPDCGHAGSSSERRLWPAPGDRRSELSPPFLGQGSLQPG
jgi:hypothetical protein